MHPALLALQRLNDRDLSAWGFDLSRRRGLLGSYMQMMNRGGSGGYPERAILAAKMKPGVDPLAKARVA